MHPFDGGYLKLIATLILDAFNFYDQGVVSNRTDVRRNWTRTTNDE